MVAAAAQKGLIDANASMLEMLLFVRRSGADTILTHFTQRTAKLPNATPSDGHSPFH
jgi:delta-aminolevulinic acid dehydratase/porphobilinogen synthase